MDLTTLMEPVVLACSTKQTIQISNDATNNRKSYSLTLADESDLPKKRNPWWIWWYGRITFQYT